MKVDIIRNTSWAAKVFELGFFNLFILTPEGISGNVETNGNSSDSLGPENASFIPVVPSVMFLSCFLDLRMAPYALLSRRCY